SQQLRPVYRRAGYAIVPADGMQDHTALPRPLQGIVVFGRNAVLCTPTHLLVSLSARRRAPTSFGSPRRRRPDRRRNDGAPSPRRRDGGAHMAWDFETEPEFQEKLDWMDVFVRERVELLDYAFRDAGAPYDRKNPVYRKITEPLKAEVK